MSDSTADFPLLVVETDLLDAVCRFASREHGHRLHAIIIRDGELVACDGYRLVRIPLIAAAQDARDDINGGLGLELAVDAHHVRAAIAAQDAVRLRVRQGDDPEDEDGEAIDPARFRRRRRCGRVLGLTPSPSTVRIDLDLIAGRTRLHQRCAIDVPNCLDRLLHWPNKQALDLVTKEIETRDPPREMAVDPNFLVDAAYLLDQLEDRDGVRVAWAELTAPAMIRTTSGVIITIMPRRV